MSDSAPLEEKVGGGGREERAFWLSKGQKKQSFETRHPSSRPQKLPPSGTQKIPIPPTPEKIVSFQK